MLHIAALTFYQLWHPFHGIGYQFWSGIGSDASELTLFGIAIGAWRHIHCQTPWCFRIGHHITADRQHKLCRKHHPDLPNRKLSLEEIHERHRAAQALAGVTGPEASNLGG